MSDTVRGVKIWNRHFMLSCCNPWYSETCARHALEIGWDSLNGRHLRGSRACHPFLYLSLYHPPVAGHSGHSGRSGRSCPGCMASFLPSARRWVAVGRESSQLGMGQTPGFPKMWWFTTHEYTRWKLWAPDLGSVKHPTFCRLWSYGSYEAVKTGVTLVVASDLNWSWQAAGKWNKKEDQCHGCHHATLGRNVCSSPDGGSCHHFSTALWLWCVFQNRSKPRTVTSEIQESDGSKKMIQTTIGGFNDVICYNHPIPEILHNF